MRSSISSGMRKMTKKLSKRAKRLTGRKSKPAKKKGKKKMNAYMIALNKARKANAPEFTYNGKTYKQKTTKTGMVIYASK